MLSSVEHERNFITLGPCNKNLELTGGDFIMFVFLFQVI